jgi:hypothetical protein
MPKCITSPRSRGSRLLTVLFGHEKLQLGSRQLLRPAAALTLSLCGFSLMAQERANVETPHGSEQATIETRNRVAFDGDAFLGSPMPYWSDGYLITRKVESFSAATPNVTLFGTNGSKSTEAAFWFPGSQRVVIDSAAVSHRGGILASGEADKADGTRAPFIALANSRGQVTNVIQTGDFFPKNICEAPDGSIWAFGGMRWDASQSQPSPGNILRRFDIQHGETASYVPRSSLPSRIQAYALSYIRCSPDRVVAYSNPAKALIEFPYTAQAPRIYRISPRRGLVVVGFAVTNSGNLYGALDDLKDGTGIEGMYTLVLDPASASGRWQPVSGAVGDLDAEGIVSKVWGADGDSLVVSRGGDPAGIAALHWVTVAPK